MARAVCPVLVICAAALLTGCWGGVTRDVAANVLSVEGEVLYQAPHQNSFRPLTPQTQPGPGAVLRTSAGAQTHLALLPGACIQVSENSEVRIEELRLTKDGNETDDGMRYRAARLRLLHGSITVVFERRDASELRFGVTTDHADLSADEDCICRIAAEKNKTRVTCVDGKAYASGGNTQRSIIKAGYFQEWPGGSVLPAADDVRAQSDVADGLEAARVLQQLLRARADRRPF